MTSLLQRSKSKIFKAFDETGSRVYTTRQIQRILQECKARGEVAANTSRETFFKFLIEEGHLRLLELQAKHYTDLTRYAWREASPYEIGASLRPEAYLSHGSAVSLHALTQHIPTRFYVNKEQSPKPSGSDLTQDSLNRAFANRQRESRYIYRHDDLEWVLLAGKHTGRLEVGTLEDPFGIPIPVTKLERTLIDITVRPTYAGGIQQVLEAYEAARSKLSVRVLIRTLKKLDYLYPYQQAIGFYMQRAGYPEATLEKIHALGQPFDFYLTHAMAEKDFDSRWRLYHPKGF